MAELTTVLTAALREKSVPIHRHTIWYYFGGMTLFLFSVQAVTGILCCFITDPPLNPHSKAFNSSWRKCGLAGSSGRSIAGRRT